MSYGHLPIVASGVGRRGRLGGIRTGLYGLWPAQTRRSAGRLVPMGRSRRPSRSSAGPVATTAPKVRHVDGPHDGPTRPRGGRL